MLKFEAAYQSMLRKYITARKPLIPFYSSVTGQIHAGQSVDTSYWAKNLVYPVLFNSAIRAILEAQLQNEIFLEIGPHSALAAPLRQILNDFGSHASYLPTLVRGKDCSRALLNAIGELYVRSIPVNFSVMSPNGSTLTNIPSYSWNHEVKYWSESRISRDWRLRKFAKHEILGSRVMESTELEPSWRNVLSLTDVPWVRDHKLHDDVVFPVAGYVAMAGEAIHQITGATEYALKDIIVGHAMVFNDSGTVEIVSNFRPVRLTSTLDSDWYEFSVASHNGSEWRKHCVGLVKGGFASSSQNEQFEHFQRLVSSPRWYSVMRKTGLNYGRNFQGLKMISASPKENIAVASVSNSLEISDDSYPLHPVEIDSCLQLLSVAMTKGISRFANQLYVPTSIGEVHIRRASSEILAKATITSSQRNQVDGNLIALSQGKTVMSMKGLGLSCLEDQMTDDVLREDALACLTWKPDVDLVEPATLFDEPLRERADLLLAEKLCLLCMVEVSNRFASSELPLNHVGKYLSWVHSQKTRAQEGKYELVQNARDYVELDSTTRLSLIEATKEEMDSTKLAVVGDCIIRVFECFSEVYHGRVDSLDVLMRDGALQGLYDRLPANLAGYLSLLSHKNPGLRVLEIGAGTGGTTSVALDSLTSEFGERMYSAYHYTDISAGFFVNAKNRFRHASNVKYSVLDISKDPLLQGYEEGSFDVVIAANVGFLHYKVSVSLCSLPGSSRNSEYQ